MSRFHIYFFKAVFFILICTQSTANAEVSVDVRFTEQDPHSQNIPTKFKGVYRNCSGEPQLLNLSKEISTSVKVVIGSSLKGRAGVTIPFGEFADLDIGGEVESSYQHTFGRSEVTILNAEQRISPYTVANYEYSATEYWQKGKVYLVDKGWFKDKRDTQSVWRLGGLTLKVDINEDKDACFETRTIPFQKKIIWDKGFDSLGRDCEMSTNKGDVIRAEFRSLLGKEFSPLPAPPGSTYVQYYFWVREGKGDQPGNTTMVVDKLERLDITGGGWEINKFLEGTDVSTGEFTLFTGPNHRLDPINHPAIRNSYWDTVKVKVDGKGGNDCRNARIELFLNTRVEIINRNRTR